MTDRAEYKCVNCKGTGHGAADRNFPIFIAKSRELQARANDVQYRFFPTADPATWEQEVDHTAPDRDLPPAPGDYGNARHRTGNEQRSGIHTGAGRGRPRDVGRPNAGERRPAAASHFRSRREQAGLSFYSDANGHATGSNSIRVRQTTLEETMSSQSAQKRPESNTTVTERQTVSQGMAVNGEMGPDPGSSRSIVPPPIAYV